MNFIARLGIKDKLLLVGAILVLILYLNLVIQGNRNARLKEDLTRTELNLKAAQDSIRISKAKDGTVQYDKLAFIAEDLKELKKINAELAHEVAITKGKVAAIQKMGVKIVHDTIKVEVEKPVVKDGVATIKGVHDTTFSEGNYRKLTTETKYNIADSTASQKIVKDEIGFTAVTGIKSTGEGYEIFLRPNYPGMVITDLQGAIVEKNFFAQQKSKPALITVGLHVGYVPFTYDLKVKKGGINLTQIGAGVGLNFNLSRILNK